MIVKLEYNLVLSLFNVPTVKIWILMLMLTTNLLYLINSTLFMKQEYVGYVNINILRNIIIWKKRLKTSQF